MEEKLIVAFKECDVCNVGHALEFNHGNIDQEWLLQQSGEHIEETIWLCKDCKASETHFDSER